MDFSSRRRRSGTLVSAERVRDEVLAPAGEDSGPAVIALAP